MNQPSIRYRGTFADLDRIETFEDRLLDLAHEVGGYCSIQRTQHDDERPVRGGAYLFLAPGMDPVYFLVDPRGWIIPGRALDAEEPLPELPWITVETAWAAPGDHLLLAELLDAIRREFAPGLEVVDSLGSHWQGAERERARRAASIISRPSEHPPVRLSGLPQDLRGGTEAEWEALARQEERRSMSLCRAVRERYRGGPGVGRAVREAGRAEGHWGLPGDEEREAAAEAEWNREMAEVARESEEDAPWRQSLPEAVCDQDLDPEALRHPAEALVHEITMRALRLKPEGAAMIDPVDPLIAGALDLNECTFGFHGSLADGAPYGMRLNAIKRGLRGIAFARAALEPLQARGFLGAPERARIARDLEALEAHLSDFAGAIRAAW